MNKKKKHNITKDILKAVKAKQREDEIREHAKPLSYNHVVRSKKQYTRKIKHKQRYF